MISGASIYISIPAFNAETTIETVLGNIPDFVDTIIVVDDDSLDNTAETVKRCQKKDSRIILVRHENNLGVGGAMKTGYLLALEKGADVIIKMDSDGQMDLAYLKKMIDPLLDGGIDFTKGNRFLHEKELIRMPIIRRIGNLGLSFLTKIASGYWNVFDPTNGYTAISSEALCRLNFERVSFRYFFEISLLLELGLQRMIVKDIYIPAIYGIEKSYLSASKSFFEFPPKLLRGMFRRIIYLYFIRDFTAITIFIIAGLVNLIFGSIWGIYHWLNSALLGVEASTGTVMIAILPLIMGFQFLLQAIVMDIHNTPQKNR